jgi:hypothetical protein
LLGQRDSVNRSPGETLFIKQAKAENADPLARYVVDDEFGDLTYKDSKFADTVMFWRQKPAPTEAQKNTAIANEATAVDPAAEKARLTALTGDQPIIISQKKEAHFKLPGL